MHGEDLMKHVRECSNTTFEQSQNVYTSRASTYEEGTHRRGYNGPKFTSDYVCKTIPREFRAAVRVLDIGAGTGLVAKELRDEGFQNIDALEPNAAMLAMARDRNLYNNYFQERISEKQCSLPKDSYDVLTGCGVYAAGAAHVPCEVLHEMIRLVKPGGYIVLTSRTNLLEDGVYKNLDQLMDKLEAGGKWKKIARDIPGKLYLDFDAIVWQYQKL